MRIAFVTPPAEGGVPERVYGCSYQVYPQPDLPALYAASSLEAAGHAVELHDLTIGPRPREAYRGLLERLRADAVVIHSVLLSRRLDLACARDVRAAADVPVAFFGPEPTRAPAEYLTDESSYVARGEAEAVLPPLLDALERGREPEGARGASYRRGGAVVSNPSAGVVEDLDSLPFPARHLVERYRDSYYNPKLASRPYTLLLTSRGCSYRCYYCVPNAASWARELEWRSAHQGAKPPVRVRSAENVVDELRAIAAQGYRSAWVMDDMFLWGRERLRAIADGAEGLGLELGVLARADHVDREAVELLRRAGCRVVNMGVESFDQRVLDYVRKDLSVGRVEQAIAAVKEGGLVPQVNIMFGTNPIESVEDAKRTVDRAIELDVGYVLFSIATPFPGTEFCEVAREKGWLIEERYRRLVDTLDPASRSLISLPNMRERDLEEVERYAKRRFYLRPGYVAGALASVRSPRQLAALARTAARIVWPKGAAQGAGR